MMVQTKCKLNNSEFFLKLFHIQSKEIGNNKCHEDTTKIEKWQSEILPFDVRKEMEDSRLNAIKQLITFVLKGRLNFSCKSATAANVDITESLLHNWLMNNHITVDKIYYLRSLFVFFLRILVFTFYFSTAENRQKNRTCGNSLKLDLSE